MIKSTDPELLKRQVLSSSSWITIEELYQQMPEARRLGLAGKWKQETKIFTLMNDNVELIPEYILGPDRHPRPIVHEILHLFRGKKSALSIAIWFISVNSWLRDERPIDCLDASPENVLNAARMEASPSDHG